MQASAYSRTATTCIRWPSMRARVSRCRSILCWWRDDRGIATGWAQGWGFGQWSKMTSLRVKPCIWAFTASRARMN